MVAELVEAVEGMAKQKTKTMKKEGKKTPTARMLLGKRGEDEACRLLERLGHRIVKRNFRTGHLEIDIISEDGHGVHFVEVKSRVAPVATAPEENVTSLKQRKIAQAALKFLNSTCDGFSGGNKEVFFDVVAVTFEKGEVKTEWFPNAFVPMYY